MDNTCPNCQFSPIPAGAKVCPSCGKTLESSTRIDVQSSVEENEGSVVGIEIASIKEAVIYTDSSRSASDAKTRDSQISIAKIGLISAIAVAIIAIIGTVVSVYIASNSSRSPIIVSFPTTNPTEGRLAADSQSAAGEAVEGASAVNPPALLPEQANSTGEAPQQPTAGIVSIAADISLDQLELLLQAANLGLSSNQTAESDAQMRSYFTGPDSAYQMIAIASLHAVGNMRLIEPVYLDMIDDKYTRLVGGEENYLTPEGKLDGQVLAQAIVAAYNDYYTKNAISFEELLQPRE